MKTYVIPNFVDRDPIFLQIVKSVAPAVIMLTQRAGSSNFQHAITEKQAREMAESLIEMSNLLEQINP